MEFPASKRHRRSPHGPVLIVEDDLEMAAFIQFSLQGAGYLCMAASTAKAAWGWLRQPTPPVAILLDRQLPDQDGIDFARQLRERDGLSIPIILLTASSENEARISAQAAGISLFLTKPILAEQLCDAVNQVVKSDDGRDGKVLGLDCLNRVALYGHRRVRLSEKLFELLALLGERYPNAVERRSLTRDIAPENRDREIDVLVSLLRKHCREELRINPIETVPSVGYRLTVPVKRLTGT